MYLYLQCSFAYISVVEPTPLEIAIHCFQETWETVLLVFS